jgi:hypothetical protein
MRYLHAFTARTRNLSDISDAIESAAAGPKKVKLGNQEVEQYGIDELVKAANHVAAQTAASQAHRGLRFTALVPPGCG